MSKQFITPVSMKVTKEQYERDLKEPLKKLGYITINDWIDFDNSNLLVTNFANVSYEYGTSSQIDGDIAYNRTYIDHYNPELFLALAAMTEGDDWIVGEYLVTLRHLGTNIFQCSKLEGADWVSGYARQSSDLYRKATTEELIKHFTMKKENMVEEEKDSRFPFKLKPQDAQRIIDIACSSWKDRLADKWANRIVTKTNIEVDYGFYSIMRKACTKEQHELFDKIFGKDTLECVFKQGEYIVYDDRTYHIETTDDGNGRVQLRSISFEGGRTIRFVSIEDINKNAHLWSIDDTKNGEPVWCEDNITNWIFRYSNGKGEIYPCQKKSINDYYGGFIVYKPFDPFNLPYNE